MKAVVTGGAGFTGSHLVDGCWPPGARCSPEAIAVATRDWLRYPGKE